jgi:hypothetical protein
MLIWMRIVMISRIAATLNFPIAKIASMEAKFKVAKKL